MNNEPQRLSGSVSDPLASDLGRRAFQGAFVTYVAQAIRLVSQIASVFIMSRLLAPEDFGLYAMVTPIYGLALMFQDLGLTQTTIQRSEISSAQISALFWINLAIGTCLALLLVLLAPSIGWFYGDERTESLTRGFAGLVLISALAAQHLALMNRCMRFRYLAVLDVVSTVLGFLGAVLLAIIFRSYWALFAMPFVTTLATAIGAWAGAGFIPGPPRRESRMRELLRMGGGIMAFNVFGFIARNLDNVLIGYTWGNGPLGLYDRAYKLLLFPLQQFSTPLARVMLPSLARLQHDPERYRSAYLQAVQQLLMAIQPGIVFTISTAHTLVPALLGEPWSGAAPIFQWLGLAALQQPLTATVNWLFVSQGRSRAYMYWGAFNAATSTAAFFAGLAWGPIGVAAAYSVTQIVIRTPVMWWVATWYGPVQLSDILGTAIPYATASAASFVAVIILQRTTTLDTIENLAASLFISYLAAILSLMLMAPGRAMLRQTLSLVFGTHRLW